MKGFVQRWASLYRTVPSPLMAFRFVVGIEEALKRRSGPVGTRDLKIMGEMYKLARMLCARALFGLVVDADKNVPTTPADDELHASTIGLYNLGRGWFTFILLPLTNGAGGPGRIATSYNDPHVLNSVRGLTITWNPVFYTSCSGI